MNIRFRAVSALLATLVVLGGTIATYTATASAESPDCTAACSFHFGEPPSTATGNTELGLQFSSDIDGWIAGICFWEAPTETGTHTVSLWDSTGTQVATATGNGTPGIENCVDLNPLVQVSAGATYTASYTANAASFVDPGQFRAQFDLNHLHAPIGAGVTGTAGALPTTNVGNSGYGVDVAFVSTLAGVITDCVSTLTAPTNPSAGPGAFSAAVSWFPATSDPAGCIAGYIVTPFLDGVAQTPVVVPGPGTTTVISGLTAGSTYTFTIAAESGRAVGPASDPTSEVTVGAPPTPTALTATHLGRGTVKVAFKAPNNDNGAAISKYTATCISNGRAKSKASHSSPIRVSGLTKGRTYYCSVRATNSRGNSPPARSAAVKA